MHLMLLRQTYLKSDAVSVNESEVKCLADEPQDCDGKAWWGFVWAELLRWFCLGPTEWTGKATDRTI